MTLGQHSDALQALMLSRSEVEFFPSEGRVSMSLANHLWVWVTIEPPGDRRF